MALIDGLISYYKLDENAANTDVEDIHGANEGTASTNTNNLYNASGKINSAFDFVAASEEFVTIPHDASLNIINAITISVWVKFRVLGTETAITDKSTGSAGVMRLWKFSNDNVYFDGPEALIRINGAPAGGFAVDTWYHIVATYDKDAGANNLKLYVNDVNVASGTDTDAMGTNAGDFYIGKFYNPISRYADGLIDEVGIWNRALSPAEVTALYNGGDGFAYPFAVVTNMKINISDVWKDIDSLKINIGDAWKNVIKVQQNIGDVWKDVYG